MHLIVNFFPHSPVGDRFYDGAVVYTVRQVRPPLRPAAAAARARDGEEG